LCDPPPANEEILPEVGQGSYFFNRIGRFLPVKATQCAGQIRCKRLVKSIANGWSSSCNYA
ncbi:hypothetical protein N0465_22990, partial [Pseudomonas aeruginosa]|nr:hypothetical protein [Pseudomonas aeruginosa]MCS8118122.1 hypothetical protein [Pseudomonas aeruginosa]MCT0977486.1 hypothetical protein [Pseudomonas aeruginosa]